MYVRPHVSPKMAEGACSDEKPDKRALLHCIWLISEALYERDVVLAPPRAMSSSHAMNEQSKLLAFARSMRCVIARTLQLSLAM